MFLPLKINSVVTVTHRLHKLYMYETYSYRCVSIGFAQNVLCYSVLTGLDRIFLMLMFGPLKTWATFLLVSTMRQTLVQMSGSM